MPVSGKSNDRDPEMAGVQGQLQGVWIFIGTLHLLENTWEAQKSHFLASTFTDSAVCELQPTLFVG